MKNKQTAVHWLVKYMETYFHLTDDSREAFKIALDKEKDQIIEAFENGFWEGCEEKLSDNTGEVYYNETYGTPR